MALGPGTATEATWLCMRDPMLQDFSKDCEVFRQHFRQFQYTQAVGPREVFSRLWELCCGWLKPKMGSMEQILELLVLEQFLTILPTEMETWVSAYGPESKESLLALIEDWQRQRHIPELQVRKEFGVSAISAKEELRQQGLEHSFCLCVSPQPQWFSRSPFIFPSPGISLSVHDSEPYQTLSRTHNTYSVMSPQLSASEIHK